MFDGQINAANNSNQSYLIGDVRLVGHYRIVESDFCIKQLDVSNFTHRFFFYLVIRNCQQNGNTSKKQYYSHGYMKPSETYNVMEHIYNTTQLAIRNCFGARKETHLQILCLPSPLRYDNQIKYMHSFIIKHCYPTGMNT